ncbi:hypothetical protein NEICINOT_03331 [Neisseria cinerea ATCC 14685]|uniref:Uncharacterized protein n=1 Tax=Neisseria cinerea ATCC 14685 TaxID=546262 RepID=D0W112_NEICI|nr:hypothetical protein NEICINOT_03331 [Neisseria cinerea ATCC 14685]
MPSEKTLHSTLFQTGLLALVSSDYNDTNPTNNPTFRYFLSNNILI